MMTFGLNRPVFSFGLMVFTTFFAPGEGRCAVTVEDDRVMDAIEYVPPEAEDFRILDNYEPRVMKFSPYQVMIEMKSYVSRVTDDRIFEVTEVRVFEQDEKDIRQFTVAECEEEDEL